MGIVRKCIFEANIGFIFQSSVGGGNTIVMKGDSTAKLTTYDCLIFDAGTSLRGNLLIKIKKILIIYRSYCFIYWNIYRL